jgi:hypothetical protein
VPPPELRGRLGRLRLRLNKVLTEGIPLNGHANGYGTSGNGHAGNGHAGNGQGARVPATPELKGDPDDSPLSGDSLIGKTWDEAVSRVGGPPGDR